jgi:hypothetical protein
MYPGELLLPDQSLQSPDGSFSIHLQAGDGNLVMINAQGQVAWASNAYGFVPAVCVMQRDGNLVVYDVNMSPRWATGSHGNNDCTLRLQNDGNLVIANAQRVVWQSRPGGTVNPPPGIVTVRNTSPTPAVARFYRTDDSVMGLLTHLPDGLLNVSSGSEASWTMPAPMQRAKLTLNGRASTAQEVVAGQTVVFSEDQRVRIGNPTGQAIDVKIFNADALVQEGPVTLPGGRFQVPPLAESFFEVPFDVDRVKVVMNDRQREIAYRGSTVAFTAVDFVRIRNLANAPHEFLLYKQSDTSYIGALPGGIFTVNGAGDERFYQVAGDVQDGVTVRIRRPARFPDLFPRVMHTVNISLGQVLVLRADLGVETQPG